jgi:hypothetical protein
VGIDEISLEDWCLQEDAESIEIRESRSIKDPQALMLARTQECAIFPPNGQSSESRYGMGGPGHRHAFEAEDCRTDLLQAAALLGVNQCD